MLIRILTKDFKKGSLTVSPINYYIYVIFAQLLERERKKQEEKWSFCMIRLPKTVSSYVLIERREYQG